MSVYIDRKHLLLLSSRLQLFKQKNEDLFNFRCPFCGDSQKNKLKARGYIYRKNNDYYYTCHNCHTSTTFSKFLKHVDTGLHKQYTLERYTNGENGNSNYKKPEFNLSGPKPFQVLTKKIKIIDVGLPSINDLEENHPAKHYIENRKIPKKYWGEIFYTENFKEFVNTRFPDNTKEEIPEDERIVLLYTNEKGEITNIAGRAIGNAKIRYCTVKVTDEKKIFGLHRLQKENRVYVFEGQFDSFFIPNSVASGDSNLGGAAAVLDGCEEVVLVYDKEPRNKDIVKQIEKSIERGYTICLLPEELPGKDINEIILSGTDPTVLKEIIDSNTFSGLTAKLKFAAWKRC